jgi:hypothetical protein
MPLDKPIRETGADIACVLNIATEQEDARITEKQPQVGSRFACQTKPLNNITFLFL